MLQTAAKQGVRPNAVYGAFHDMKTPARQSWHLISWPATGDNDGAPALTGPGLYKTGKTCWATRYHCCAGEGPAWRWLHERWLQRVNATEIACGIAVTTAHDAGAPPFC